MTDPGSSTSPIPSEHDTGAEAEDTRGAPLADTRGVTRYPTMTSMVASLPLDAADFAESVAAHAEFIASGGGGGRWETMITTTDESIAIVFGIYLGPKTVSGEQAALAHSRLDGLDLRGVQLPYADLCGCWGRGADLSGANLAGSLLVDTDFQGANFDGADLSGADLSRAELMRCSFRGANLRGADFEKADLTGADLREADTEGAKWPGTILDGVLR
jgi:uncharacterized protein YjbI with pentapeptide repeats